MSSNVDKVNAVNMTEMKIMGREEYSLENVDWCCLCAMFQPKRYGLNNPIVIQGWQLPHFDRIVHAARDHVLPCRINVQAYHFSMMALLSTEYRNRPPGTQIPQTDRMVCTRCEQILQKLWMKRCPMYRSSMANQSLRGKDIEG